MSKQFDSLSQKLIDFIELQKIFFVGTAGAEGRVNISPKGMDSFRVLGPNKVAWLNLTGSGNESAAHVLENGRMTIMFHALEGPPMILRLYGKASVVHTYDSEWDEYVSQFPETPGSRQVFVIDVDLVQTSCGFAVPLYEYKEDRDILSKWAKNIGKEGIEEYWAEKNVKSIDGYPTNVLSEEKC